MWLLLSGIFRPILLSHFCMVSYGCIAAATFILHEYPHTNFAQGWCSVVCKFAAVSVMHELWVSICLRQSAARFFLHKPIPILSFLILRYFIYCMTSKVCMCILLSFLMGHITASIFAGLEDNFTFTSRLAWAYCYRIFTWYLGSIWVAATFASHAI